VAVGEPVRLLVRSADGVHGIEIKKVKVQKMIPRGGEPVIINFTAKEAGRFPILCSEYCGDEHDNMRGMLVVVAPSDGESK
jgi:cytochrome c oxidase subunit 2